jgi:hypothetical protein
VTLARVITPRPMLAAHYVHGSEDLPEIRDWLWTG